MSDHLFDEEEIDSIKATLSGKLYQNIAELHSEIERSTDCAIATDIVLTALSINIGHIVGQLSPKLRKRSIKVINTIIKEQMIEVGKLEDVETFGQIGHA